ncbi:hypothetical protein ACHAXA_001677 [Cyclostephanos tholiformis]|uniref:Uncharacterized protein n=1 Tax=Cyclostephanos tholiformis TaxID=382380 RepID=A0ABD3RSD5_9STRA
MPPIPLSSITSPRLVGSSLSTRCRGTGGGGGRLVAAVRNRPADSTSELSTTTTTTTTGTTRERRTRFATTTTTPRGGGEGGDDGKFPISSSFVIDGLHSFTMGTFAGVLGSLAGMGGGFVMIPMMTAARRSFADASPDSASSRGPPPPRSWSSGRWWVGGLGLNQHVAHGTSLFAVGTTGLAGALGYGIRSGVDDDDDENKDDNDGGSTAMDGSRVDADDDSSSRLRGSTSDDHDDHLEDDAHPPPPPPPPPPPTGGYVELDAALALALSAAITARFGAIASSKLSGRTLRRALGAYMMIVSPLVPARAYYPRGEVGPMSSSMPRDDDVVDVARRRHEDDDRRTTHSSSHPSSSSSSSSLSLERLLPISIIGVFSGFLSGMFGVGGGTIVVPSLVLSTDMPYQSALGTSLCAMILPAMVGTYTNAKLGNICWRVAPFLAAGSAVGAYVGARGIGLKVDEGILKLGFSCLMMILGVSTWRKGSR